MKKLTIFALFAIPAFAQTPEERLDRIIADATALKAELHGEHTLLPKIDNSKIPAPAIGFAEVRIKPEPNGKPKQNTDGTGQFRFACTFSHMNYDDPIVYPGQALAAHLHTYFGNTAINYATTPANITTAGNSTCAGGIANRTGYWVPAVIDTKDGTPLKPSEILVYYKSSNLGNVKPYPAGLRMVTGDMKATEPQTKARVTWACLTPTGSGAYIKNIPAICPVGNTIEASIDFPNCWDGINLDSPDHKSHMSYITWNNDLRKNECPKTHPVELPMLAEKVKYLVTEAGSTARWRLSSDNYGTDKPGGYSIHADWFNGWDQKVQETWVKNCLQANRDCHGFLLGDGTTLF
jgi:Domain of unknown function (DUF1996)